MKMRRLVPAVLFIICLPILYPAGVFCDETERLWDMFLKNSETDAGADLLVQIGKEGQGNRKVIENLNNFLLSRNRLFESGESVNYAVVSACITAIIEAGDDSSLPALFGVISAGYPEVIANEAYGAIELIPGDLKQFLLEIIRDGKPSDKCIAFRIACESRKLNHFDKGQMAELALEQSYSAYDGSSNPNLLDMRYSAVVELTSLKWIRAAELAVRHYYHVQTDYRNRIVPKERFVEAIAFLGATGSYDAVLVLGLQLGLINARAERTGGYDHEITLAIVQALGEIGSKDVYDQLYTAGLMPYSEDIIAASKEAIDRLKW